jgi:hypothetical protein
MVDKGDDENLRGLKNCKKSNSICVCRVDLYMSVVGLDIMRKQFDYWELRKIAIVCWFYNVDHAKGGAVVLCKTCEVVTRELICVVFLILCAFNLRDGVKNTRLCNMFELRDLCWKCNMGLGFCGSLMWFWVHMVWRYWEGERRPMGPREKD